MDAPAQVTLHPALTPHAGPARTGPYALIQIRAAVPLLRTLASELDASPGRGSDSPTVSSPV